MICIRCRRPIKPGHPANLGPQCARIVLELLTKKPEPVREVDVRQVDWVKQETATA